MFSTMTGAVRQFNKRSDLDIVPSISESRYTVPLEGGWTCWDLPNCTNELLDHQCYPRILLMQVRNGLLL
jgi:hypothetical protein